MESLTLTAQPRDTGKKAVKATRRNGLVPCVIYGPHLEPVHFAVATLALRPLIHTTEQYRISVDVLTAVRSTGSCWSRCRSRASSGSASRG